MTETIEVLKKARELISDPKRWTQGTFARDARGSRVSSRDETAVCWCAVGAIRRASCDIPSQEDALDILHPAMARDIGRFNDGHTHAEVLAAFDKAIERASA